MVLQLFATTTENIATGTNVILVILGVLGLIGIIGAVSAYFYKGRADALIKLQREEINTLKEINARITEQNATMKTERIEFIAEQKRMRNEIKTLRTLLAQPRQLNNLAKTMAQQHIDVMGKLTDLAAGIVDTAAKG